MDPGAPEDGYMLRITIGLVGGREGGRLLPYSGSGSQADIKNAANVIASVTRSVSFRVWWPLAFFEGILSGKVMFL